MLVSVHRSVALEMNKAGPGPAPAVEETAGRAAPGTKLAAFRSETVRAKVQITAIDLANQTVSFVVLPVSNACFRQGSKTVELRPHAA